MIKYGILLVIRLYWLIPEHKRRGCIFHESCSRYVYRITKEEGFRSGIKALKYRIRTCRPGYKLSKVDGRFELHLKDGTILPEEQISPNLLYPKIDFHKIYKPLK